MVSATGLATTTLAPSHPAPGTAAPQLHALHGKQNALLHRLLPIAHIRQRPHLDHTLRVLEVSALGVVG